MGHRLIVILFIGMVLFFSVSWGEEVRDIATIQITSPAFQNNGRIPNKYTCDGKDINPPLMIGNVPQGTRSIAVIIEHQPSMMKGIWSHWLLWNIDPNVKEIKENAVPAGAVQGMNDFGGHSYGGPCPPPNFPSTRYFFKVYALDTMLSISPNSQRADLEKALKGHILAEGQLIGL